MEKIIIPIMIILLGTAVVGCGQQQKDEKTIPAPSSKPEQVVKKQPKVEKPKENSHSFCETQGHEIIIRFDEASQSSKAFCRFSDTTECEADAYYHDTCVPGTSSEQYVSPTQESDTLANCGSQYEPVCGGDGITYSNTCIAQTQGITILHGGVCTSKEQADIKKVESKPIVFDNSSGDPSWLKIVKDFTLSSPVSDPPAFIQKCNYSNNTYYYHSEGCADCFNTLYDDVGNMVCYPSKDLASECPSFIKSSTRNSYCKQVWIDER